MNIEHLREFSYLAETLSFGITAKHFFISTSVLSKHIAAMESDLGVRLFERSRHNVELTHEGRLFYEGVNTVLNDFDHALESISLSNQGATKTLRVGYLRGAASPFLSHFVRHFATSYPDIDLSIQCMEYGELLRAHRSHAVDALLDINLDKEAALACDSIDIYTDRLYVVVGKDHNLANRIGGISVSELNHEDILLPDITTYPGYVEHCEKVVRAAGNAHVSKRYRDVSTLFFSIEDNDRVGFSSGHNFHAFKNRAMFLPINDFDTSYPIGIRWLRATDDRLIDAMRETAESCRKHMAKWSDGVKEAAQTD